MLRSSIKKNFHLVTIILLIALVGTLSVSEFNYSYGESHENKREPVSKPKKVGDDRFSQKIHPQIIEIMNNAQPEIKARSYGVLFQNNELDVYVYLNPEFQKNPPKDLNILTQDGNIIFTRLTFDQIENISDLESVVGITMPINAVPRDHALSEGVAWSFADSMHAVGFTGNGVTVAVIDEGFDSSNAEISGNIGFSSFQTGCVNLLCGDTAGNSHGTAVAESVVDMAPDVNLRVYAILNSVGFNNAIDNAILNNVDIITTSLGFPGAGGDGTTGQYRDGTSTVAKKANDAKNAGILVTTAVGNQGQSHWQGTYSASPVTPSSIGLNPLTYESVMDFRPLQSGVQRACLPVTDVGDTYLTTWNDWNNSNQDYDFFLYNAAMDTVFDASTNPQDGIGLDNPIEIIPAIGSVPPSTLCLVIASDSSTQNHFFHIDVEGNSINDPNKVRAGSLDTPADATGALAVGAINQFTDALEAFSSSGPTDDSRNKPEICGPDNTLSHQSGLNPFFGSSAATPHVAGAAALLLEQNPSLTLDQLRNKLIDEARFNASYSVNNLCGSNSGAVSLQTAANDLSCPVVPQSGSWIISSDCIMTTDTTVPGNVVVQNNSVLTILNGVTLNIDFSNNNLTVKSGSGVKIESGSKIT